uniref:DUF725 domain-containing protein n=1 Tax=Haemonchus contortus TaxID=6289 RepID=A0A7I4Y084_HAECO
MQSFVVSLICSILLLIEGAFISSDFKCDENVPDIARKALIGAINEERKQLGLPFMEDRGYDCALAKKAVEGVYGTSGLNIINVESTTFKNNWDETLKNALKSSKNGMTRLAKRIGCEIKLSTSEDGSHNAKLYCLLDELVLTL